MIRKSVLRVLVTCLIVGLAGLGSAHAKAMSYAYMEASAIIDTQVELEDGSNTADGNGGGLAFSFLMGPVAYSEWMYDNLSLDSSTDGDELTARFGAKHRFQNFEYGKLDLYGGVSIDAAEFTVRTPGGVVEILDDTGLGGYIGLKHGPTHHVEYGGDLSVNNIEDVAISIRLYAQWNITHALALRAGYRATEYALDGADLDVDVFSIAARVTFGTP